MADGKIRRSSRIYGAKRKRILDTVEDEKAQGINNFVREYLGAGAKLWVVTRHVLPTSRGSGHIDHEEFVFADKTMAESMRDIMIEDVMVHYIDLKYNVNDICSSAKEADCRCQSCGDRQLKSLQKDPVAFAAEHFPDAMEYLELGVDGNNAYIGMTEWTPPVVLSSLNGIVSSGSHGNMPFMYTRDVTTTHAYQKYSTYKMEEKIHNFHVMQILSYTPAQQQTLGLDASLELFGHDKKEWKNVFLGIGRECGDTASILEKLLRYSNDHYNAVMLHYPLNEDVRIEVFVFDHAIRFYLQDRYK